MVADSAAMSGQPGADSPLPPQGGTPPTLLMAGGTRPNRLNDEDYDFFDGFDFYGKM